MSNAIPDVSPELVQQAKEAFESGFRCGLESLLQSVAAGKQIEELEPAGYAVLFACALKGMHGAGASLDDVTEALGRAWAELEPDAAESDADATEPG